MTAPDGDRLPATNSGQETPLPMRVEFGCGRCLHLHGVDRPCRSVMLGAEIVCGCPGWIAPRHPAPQQVAFLRAAGGG